MNRVKEEGLVALTILATAGVLCTIFQQTIGDFILVSVVAYGISAVSRVYARKQEAERAADRMRVDEIVRRVNDRLIVKGDDLSAEEIRTQEKSSIKNRFKNRGQKSSEDNFEIVETVLRLDV